VYNNDVPMMGLWAQRSNEQFFDNPVNNALIDRDVILQLIEAHTVRRTKPTTPPDESPSAPHIEGDEQSKTSSTRPIRILVMDDMVGTQRTFVQLIQYLKLRLGEFFTRLEVRFIFLFTPRPETVTALHPFLLSQDEEIVRSYKPIELEVVTGKSELPYRKSIHYGSITQPQADVQRD
ncbi:MAG: hypothetical protein LC808_17855, partial [Actinobacteria bacterium]|nr:hypothetical protein [Actinomycetota bacterium]